ncbi:hypothetical protein HYALB_00010086 [Hymenoscyphus albidus]|uniref:Uncharacterized protein n=1 Tax=Hymenoscyphus albidus TaxID=595503 RepID=A0A9N9Q546_9HELO|nr:hypothetical protein HYALB_00010086 [Hymenoscyphus albidus]
MSSIDLYIRVICKEIFDITGKICIQFGRKAPSPEKQMQEKVEKFIVEVIMDPIYNGPTDYITVKEIKDGSLEIHVDVGIRVAIGEDNFNATVKRRSINWK